MSAKLRICSLLLALVIASPALAGSIWLTGHDILDHNGADGYWRVIVDYLRGDGTASEIDEANYDIVVLCPGACTDDMRLPSAMTDPGPWTGPEIHRDPATLDNAGWAEVFSKDLIIVVESIKIGAAGRSALNGKKAELEAYFDAGGDLWMNTNNGHSDYYTVLPPSVVATGSSIETDNGFSPTAAGAAIGITDDMVNGDESHNIFTSVAPGLVVYELFQGDQIMSVGRQDISIADLSGRVALPALSTWALLLLLFSVSILAMRVLRTR